MATVAGSVLPSVSVRFSMVVTGIGWTMVAIVFVEPVLLRGFFVAEGFFRDALTADLRFPLSEEWARANAFPFVETFSIGGVSIGRVEELCKVG